MQIQRLTAVAGLLASLAWSSPALTQQPKAPREQAAEAMTAQARKLYLDGVKAFSQSRWADARAAFLGALALHYHYTIVGNLGASELRLGQYRHAAEHLAAYVREMANDTTSTPQERAAGAATYAEARARVGAVVLKINVDRAAVVLGDEVLGNAPLADPVFVEPGTTTLLVEREGYVTEKVVVDVAAGSETERVVELKKKEVVATSPALPPRRGSEKEADTGPRTALLIGGAATAGALAVAGVVLAVVAGEKSGDAEMQRDALKQRNGADACSKPGASSECEAVSGAFDTYVDLKNAAFWSFAGAGVIGAGTLVYGLMTRTPERERRVQLIPVVGPNGVGLSLGGVL